MIERGRMPFSSRELHGAPVETRWRVFNWPGWARWTLTLSFLALINWVLFAPALVFKDVHVFLAHQDKIAHGTIFLTLALLVLWSLPEWGSTKYSGGGRARLAVLAALVLYAGSMELLQPLLAGSGRQFEWLDMACNFSGVCAGWLLFPKVAVESGRGL